MSKRNFAHLVRPTYIFKKNTKPKCCIFFAVVNKKSV